MTILYADDDVEDRMLFLDAFAKVEPAISCITVCNGKQLLQRLREVQELPDLVFLDINMPMMDGRECLIELKQDQRLRTIPVVIYSTTSNKSEVADLLTLGAISFIQKASSYRQSCADLTRFIHSFECSTTRNQI
jgi:CheY-like chemotaxis protein